jgi:hypothetical protein
VWGTLQEIVGTDLRAGHVLGRGMSPAIVEPGARKEGAHREMGVRASCATEDSPPDRLRY